MLRGKQLFLFLLKLLYFWKIFYKNSLTSGNFSLIIFSVNPIANGVEKHF